MSKGKFIVLEGLDLTGKSTIVKRMKEKYPDYIYTREPGGTGCDLAENIRNVILSHNELMDPTTEAYLFAASRAEHVKQINEWIADGKTVICDRFVYSSMYYQGIVKEYGVDRVKAINSHAINGLRPDAVFFVTTSEAERNRRMELRKEEFNELDRLSTSINYIEANIKYYNVVNKEYNHDAILIDTTDGNTDKCVELIVKEINRMRPILKVSF